MANTSVGMNFIVMVDGKRIAGQRGATLNQSADTIEATSKDSNGWKEFETSFKEWSIDADGLLPVDDEGYDALQEAFNSGVKLEVEVSTIDGVGYTGEALVTDFPIEMPYDDLATYSVTFQGTGELKKSQAV